MKSLALLLIPCLIVDPAFAGLSSGDRAAARSCVPAAPPCFAEQAMMLPLIDPLHPPIKDAKVRFDRLLGSQAGAMGAEEVTLLGVQRRSQRSRLAIIHLRFKPSPSKESQYLKLKSLFLETTLETAKARVLKLVRDSLSDEEWRLAETAPIVRSHIHAALRWFETKYKGDITVFEHHDRFKGIGHPSLIAVGARYQDNSAAWLHEILEAFFIAKGGESTDWDSTAKSMLNARINDWYGAHRIKSNSQSYRGHALVRALVQETLPAQDDELTWLIRNDEPYSDFDRKPARPKYTDLRQATTDDEQKFIRTLLNLWKSPDQANLSLLQTHRSLWSFRRRLSPNEVDSFLRLYDEHRDTFFFMLDHIVKPGLDSAAYQKYVDSPSSVLHRLIEKKPALYALMEASAPKDIPAKRTERLGQKTLEKGKSQVFYGLTWARLPIGNASYKIELDEENGGVFYREGGDSTEDVPSDEFRTFRRFGGDYEDPSNPQLKSPHCQFLVSPRKDGTFDLTLTALADEGLAVEWGQPIAGRSSPDAPLAMIPGLGRVVLKITRHFGLRDRWAVIITGLLESILFGAVVSLGADLVHSVLSHFGLPIPKGLLLTLFSLVSWIKFADSHKGALYFRDKETGRLYRPYRSRLRKIDRRTIVKVGFWFRAVYLAAVLVFPGLGLPHGIVIAAATLMESALHITRNFRTDGPMAMGTTAPEDDEMNLTLGQALKSLMKLTRRKGMQEIYVGYGPAGVERGATESIPVHPPIPFKRIPFTWIAARIRGLFYHSSAELRFTVMVRTEVGPRPVAWLLPQIPGIIPITARIAILDAYKTLPIYVPAGRLADFQRAVENFSRFLPKNAPRDLTQAYFDLSRLAYELERSLMTGPVTWQRMIDFLTATFNFIQAIDYISEDAGPLESVAQAYQNLLRYIDANDPIGLAQWFPRLPIHPRGTVGGIVDPQGNVFVATPRYGVYADPKRPEQPIDIRNPATLLPGSRFLIVLPRGAMNPNDLLAVPAAPLDPPGRYDTVSPEAHFTFIHTLMSEIFPSAPIEHIQSTLAALNVKVGEKVLCSSPRLAIWLAYNGADVVFVHDDPAVIQTVQKTYRTYKNISPIQTGLLSTVEGQLADPAVQAYLAHFGGFDHIVLPQTVSPVRLAALKTRAAGSLYLDKSVGEWTVYIRGLRKAGLAIKDYIEVLTPSSWGLFTGRIYKIEPGNAAGSPSERRHSPETFLAAA